MAVITVVGAGAMGSAMSFPARERGHTVRLVGTMLDREIVERLREDGYHLNLKRTLPAGCEFYQLEELDAALAGAGLIIGGVSSFGVDWFLGEIIPRLPENLPVLSVTKGMIDRGDGGMQTFPYLYGDAFPGRSFSAIGGPCTSYELADGDSTHVCFCGDDIARLRWMKSLLATDTYHVSLSTDVIGVECAVAMKNAYALGVSLAVGLAERRDGGIHYNSQAALFAQSIREMRRLLALTGGGDDNIVLGAGDLYVTIYGGRTRRIGTLLGRGLSFDEAMAELSGVTLESVVIASRTANVVRALIERGEVSAADFPLLLHIDDILRGAPVAIPWDAFETETER